MRSPTLPAFLGALVLAGVLMLVAAAPPALAHGLLVVDDGGRATAPTPSEVPTPAPRPERGPVTLEDHRVHAKIRGPVADVTVEQVFHSKANRQLEGTYLFPLPEGATVAKFAMTMGGKMVQGEILEADQARRVYHSIVRRQRDPGLLEYVGRGLFRARVFPILPGKDLTIRLTFQQILPDHEGTLEWRYPLATARMHADPVRNALVNVEIESDVDLKAIYSPSHDVAVVRDGNRKAQVSYERAGRRMDRDFLLYVGRSPQDVGFSFASTRRAGEDGTFLAVLAPSAVVSDQDREPKDVVFVVDVSGSMADDGKIDQARRALRYGVQTLRPGDRFNVVAFSTQVRGFREHLVDWNDATRDAAVAWIDALQPAGGTNIEGALKEALRRQGDRLHLVVFLTDGQPTIGERDTNRLAALVDTSRDQPVRIFTFGVGFDLDVQLLDRIAEATRATRDYVMPDEDLEIVASRFFRKVSLPVMTDVEVELGEGIHDVYPTRLPDLYAGSQIVLLGRYADAGHRLIRLRGKVKGREVVRDYEAAFTGEQTADYLPRLWAHRKVGYLLDEIRLHGENQELVDEVVRLATHYGIVTPYTAGLVVEEGELMDAPTERLREDRGQSIVRRLRSGLVPMPGAASAPADSGATGGGAGRAMPPEAPAPEREARDSEALKKLKDGYFEGDDEAPALDAARDKVKAVAGKTFLQSNDGKWVDTEYDGKSETEKVEAYSDAWMALLEKLVQKHGAKAERLLAVGEKAIVVLDGKAYEIVPPATK